ncbi:MAG: hypothetical protein DMF69_06195, partial [Acidobacteria bacterium]
MNRGRLLFFTCDNLKFVGHLLRTKIIEAKSMHLITSRFSISAALCIATLLIAGVSAPVHGQPAGKPLPHIVEKDGRHALLVDGEPYLMLGVQVNNSSAWPS